MKRWCDLITLQESRWMCLIPSMSVEVCGNVIQSTSIWKLQTPEIDKAKAKRKVSYPIVMTDKDALLKEYELSQDMHNYYGKITWEIGAIFLGGGLAGFGFGLQAKLTPVGFTLLIVALTVLVWSFGHHVRRYRIFAISHLMRCREIEQELGLKQHMKAYEAHKDGIEIEDKRQRAARPSGWTTIKLAVILILITFWVAVILRWIGFSLGGE